MSLSISSSPEQTKQIAAAFTKTLTGGEVILLEGDLGSGKTTFVQGVAEALGCEGAIRSPTFSIMNIYPTSHPTIKRLIHMDLYRLKNASELTPLSLEEQLDAGSILLVEWSKLLEPFLEVGYRKVSFKVIPEGRAITF
ncbi:tRNA (adenosine(37)-N6)-threonylcarbamoyltransferase complex ATPase subunit type 1 TsaE [Candidatus Uhrbacteria bacterium]|nr:tRNA (adenosine(37)-N6)-threonylcarbamoyltransferase complex ATPase subunit type 1 TsaE [Candidatus Uhrbacteria bacterium]